MNIKFANEEVFERYRQMLDETESLENSLHKSIVRLSKWNPYNHTAVIYNDFDEKSFFFQVYDEEEKQTSFCGGIIYHRSEDGYGSGSGPTFSVTVEPTHGYSIHT